MNEKFSHDVTQFFHSTTLPKSEKEKHEKLLCNFSFDEENFCASNFEIRQ